MVNICLVQGQSPQNNIEAHVLGCAAGSYSVTGNAAALLRALRLRPDGASGVYGVKRHELSGGTEWLAG